MSFFFFFYIEIITIDRQCSKMINYHYPCQISWHKNLSQNQNNKHTIFIDEKLLLSMLDELTWEPFIEAIKIDVHSLWFCQVIGMQWYY